MRFDGAAMSPNGQWIATVVHGSPAVSLWDSAKNRLLMQLPAAEPLGGVAFLDDDHVVVGGQAGHLEILDVSGRHRTVPEVMRLARESTRWHLVNGRAVERE